MNEHNDYILLDKAHEIVSNGGDIMEWYLSLPDIERRQFDEQIELVRNELNSLSLTIIEVISIPIQNMVNVLVDWYEDTFSIVNNIAA